MTQEVTLQTVEVVARPQSDLRIPSEISPSAIAAPHATTLATARQEAPWLIAPPSLPGGYQILQAFDVSLAKPDSSRFPEFHLIYVNQEDSGLVVRQTLAKEYPIGTDAKAQVVVYGGIEPIALGSSRGALLTFEEVILSPSAVMPAIARVYGERDGVLIEVEGPPKEVADLVRAAEALLGS